MPRAQGWGVPVHLLGKESLPGRDCRHLCEALERHYAHMLRRHRPLNGFSSFLLPLAHCIEIAFASDDVAMAKAHVFLVCVVGKLVLLPEGQWPLPQDVVVASTPRLGPRREIVPVDAKLAHGVLLCAFLVRKDVETPAVDGLLVVPWVIVQALAEVVVCTGVRHPSCPREGL